MPKRATRKATVSKTRPTWSGKTVGGKKWKTESHMSPKSGGPRGGRYQMASQGAPRARTRKLHAYSVAIKRAHGRGQISSSDKKALLSEVKLIRNTKRGLTARKGAKI